MPCCCNNPIGYAYVVCTMPYRSSTMHNGTNGITTQIALYRTAAAICKMLPMGAFKAQTPYCVQA